MMIERRTVPAPWHRPHLTWTHPETTSSLTRWPNPSTGPNKSIVHYAGTREGPLKNLTTSPSTTAGAEKGSNFNRSGTTTSGEDDIKLLLVLRGFHCICMTFHPFKVFFLNRHASLLQSGSQSVRQCGTKQSTIPLCCLFISLSYSLHPKTQKSVLFLYFLLFLPSTCFPHSVSSFFAGLMRMKGGGRMYVCKVGR